MRTELTSIKEYRGMHLMGHTCANLNGELLFVWGGTAGAFAGSGEQQPAVRNTELWIYETLTGYWRRRTCTGECPPYLSSCSSCLIGRRMFIFGGHSTALDDWLNCLYCLDLESFEWSDLGARARANQPGKPVRSDKNVCWSYKDKLYVFGGYGWSRAEHYMDILDRQRDFELAPDFRWPKFGWNNQLVEFDPARGSWRWPSYTGKCPSARAAHAGTLMSDDKFYLFGGRDSQQRLNDLYTLDMKRLEWSQLAVFESSESVLRPIGHLLDDSDVDDDDGGGGGGGDDDDDHDDDDHDHHNDSADDARNSAIDDDAEQGQIIDEVIQAQTEHENDDAEVAEPMPSSSSSSSSNRAQQLGQASGSSTRAQQAAGATPAAPSSDDDYEDDADEFARPSHLLERCSLGSLEHHSDQCLGSEHNSAPANSGLDLQHTHHAHRAAADIDASNQDARLANDAEQNLQLYQPEADLVASNAFEEQKLPVGRSFCSFTPISDEDIILYGGVSSQDQNLDDCWQFNIKLNRWAPLINFNSKHKKPRLWHSGSRTKQNEVVIIGGSSSEKIDEFCTDVLIISLEPKTLKRLALDAVSRSIRQKTIQKCPKLPSTICKLIRLRKQAIAFTSLRKSQQAGATIVMP